MSEDIKKTKKEAEKTEKKAVKTSASAQRNKNYNPDEVAYQNIVSAKTPFGIKEAYKTTRTNIMFSLASIEGCKTILVSSSIPGEGKTLTTINIAITFAQTGAKVLVIDGDMRKSKIHRYMGVDNKIGLSNVLGSFITLDQAIKHNEEFGIDYISTGHTPPNPLELLTSQKMADILEELKTKYDYIFIDTPPVNVVADTTAVSGLADGVLFIVRHKYTTQDMLYKALSSLEFANAKVLGFVLNDVDLSNFTYSAKSRYGRYSYRNYYSYSNYYY